MKQRILALLLALVMVVGLLTACSNNTDDSAGTGDEPGNAAPESVKINIGFPEAPVANATITAMKANRVAVLEAVGGKLITEIFDFTPEGTVDACEKLIQAGADGIMVTPFAESILPSISQMCEEAGVYFILSMRTMADPEIKALVEANPYYVGAVYEDDYSLGYALGKAFAEAGGKYYALIGLATGDTAGDTRELGLAAAAEEFGLTQVSEVRAYAQASEATSATESFIASFPQLDGIIRVGATAPGDTNAICAAIETAGKSGEVMFFANDSEEGNERYLASGTLTMTMGDALILDAVISTTLLCNAILGTPLADEPIYIELPYPGLETAEEFEILYNHLLVDEPVFTAEQTREWFIQYFNSDVTLSSVQGIIDKFTPTWVGELKNN